MAIKEVAGGVFALGGTGGVGYMIYHSTQPKTIGDLMINELSDDDRSKSTGIPFTLISNWWDKGFHRFVIEKNGTLDTEFSSISGIEDTDKEAFTKACKNLLDAHIDSEKSSNDDKKDKAKKWCVTYETIESSLDKKLNTDASKKSDWVTKYGTATGDSAPYKDTVKKMHSGTNETDDSKAAAMQKWCQWVLHAKKETTTVKDKFTGDTKYCVLEGDGG